MTDKSLQQTEALALLCPTCGARYTLPKYVEGQKYGCKRCSASLMFGKFALQKELGRGGFGVVYKAFQADLQRIVALKFLHTDSDDSTERFMREARIAANLNHPNITAIFEVGQHDGKPYITMQYVDGITTNKADFRVREAVSVIRDAAVAVDYAHAREIIHRDIKPHNIMVTSERSGTSPADMTRRTYVMDFGLARSANKGGTLTTEGQIMGTPAFMSPEQAEGRPCDVRSDVYSLGATLYSLCAKRAPFEAPTPLQILMQVTQQEPPPPSSINPEIDKGLEAIILKAMAKDPAQRYATASRFAQDLTGWMAGGVTDAGPTVRLGGNSGALRAAGARKNKGAMVALGLALILAGAGGMAWRLSSQPSKAETATGPKTPMPVTPLDPAPPVPGPDPVVPAPSTVLLEVRTDPPDATLRIGNKEWPTPVSLNETKIAPGTYEVVLSKPGFKTRKEQVTLTAGPSTVILDKKLEREARKVAFTVASDPPGARILLNSTDTGSMTPATIYEDEVRGVLAQIELELPGYVPAKQSFEPNGETRRISLIPKNGTLVVNGAVAGATVYFLPIPDGVKNVKALAGLWSENLEQLEQAVKSLDPADVPFAVERLKVLAAHPELRVRERAAKLAGTPGSPHSVRPEKAVGADGRGRIRYETAWILNHYRVLATSPRSQDFLSDELEPRHKEDLEVKAEMTLLASMGVSGMHPGLGQFRVLNSAQNQVGVLRPGGPSILVSAGSFSLHYAPPPNDPVLREFILNVTVTDRLDLSGSLYKHCAEAYERERSIPMAIRAYQKMLEEKQTGEQADRARLAEKVRSLYRAWIEGNEKLGKPLGGDFPARIEDARKKPPADATAGLMEIYTAKDGPREARGAAAGSLALNFARLSQPYEAVEWAERAVAEKFDFGADTADTVVAAIKGYPGLQERWEPVAAALDGLKKPVAVTPPPPAPPSPPPAGAPTGTLGILFAINKYGIFVRLEAGVQLSKGDVLEVVREGAVVGEIVVDKILAPDKTYPNGSAQCQGGAGAIRKNDEVRRKK